MSSATVRRTNPDEECARVYLLNHFSSVERHPCGKHRPPDLLAGNKVAVEVMRVSQRSQTGSLKDLDRLEHNIRNVLEEFNRPDTLGTTCEVSFKQLRGPVPKGKGFRARTKRALKTFLQAPAEGELRISPDFTLEISRAAKIRAQKFILVGGTDRGIGGFVVPEMHRKLQLCVEEKTQKVAGSRREHPEWKWWLVLVDRTELGMTESDFEDMRSQMGPIRHDFWDKAILLEPNARRRDLEL